MTTMMTCGHAANAVVTNTDQPVCVICVCADVADQPDLTGRIARCSYYGGKCRSEQPSDTRLAFFSHSPERDHDTYYCGCYGWD